MLEGVRWRRLARVLPALIVLAVLVPALDRGSLWIDEVRSLVIARDPSSVVHALTQDEANMGLYYVLLTAWTTLGDSDAWVRALSLLAALACLGSARALGGWPAAVLLATHATFLETGREVRGYALMLALSLGASGALRRAVERGRWRAYLGWAVLGAAAFHAHALALLIGAAHAVALLIAPRTMVRWSRVLVASLLAVVLIAGPWWLQAGGEAQLDWIAPRSLGRSLRILALRAGGGHAVLAGVGWGLAVAGTVILARRRWRFSSALVVSMAWVPPLVLLLLDRAVQPLYLDRYAVVVVPGLVLAAGAALRRIRRPAHRGAALVLAGAALLSGLDLRPREDWRGAAEHIAAHARPGDAVVVFAYFCRPALERYLGRAPVEVIELASGPYAPGGGTRLPEPDLSRLAGHRRVWLVSSHERFPRLGRDQQHRALTEQLAISRGDARTQRLRGVRVALYGR